MPEASKIKGMKMTNVIDRRYDFVFLFDVQDGNPNGDPDMANAPRFDPETMQGLVSDVSIKRKIRDYVAAFKSQDGRVEEGYDIFVASGHSLESRQRMPYDNLKDLDPKKTDRSQVAQARDWMCRNFFDVRAFGAVMSTKEFNCGQVRGPVQVTFARSEDRILSTEHGITRVAYTKEEKKAGTLASTEMGNKHTVAYGLYRGHGFVNANLAPDTGFSNADLDLLWRALANMFDLDRSAGRGLMSARNLFVFEHESKLGNAPARRLFDLIKVEKKEGVEMPRAYEDYIVTVNRDKLPTGVTVSDKLND